ncbi:MULTISPECIES: hypothetical protein [Alcanivorax]|uniref:hypothetical protein n=1 Tax=Alcanivorax TaxID=59753 RepID=UPI0025B92CBB|nr:MULTISPECIES: hypothetical protein [Alcanivorax]
MRFLGIFFLVMGLWATGAMAEELASASTEEQAKKSPDQQAMDQLAEAGLRQALQAIQRSGGLYPFGLIQSGETVQAVGYSGDKEDAPSAEEWAQGLFMQLRKIGKEQPDIELMGLFRLHDITGDNGEKITGVWAQVDHRDVRPWVIFLPLIKNDAGKHELGDMVYYATEQPLFEKSGE